MQKKRPTEAFRHAKHYNGYDPHWKDYQTIMLWSCLPQRGIYFIDDVTGQWQFLENEIVNKDDIHYLYSPDRSCFIGDSYWDRESFRSIYLYDFQSQRSRHIVSLLRAGYHYRYPL